MKRNKIRRNLLSFFPEPSTHVHLVRVWTSLNEEELRGREGLMHMDLHTQTRHSGSSAVVYVLVEFASLGVVLHTNSPVPTNVVEFPVATDLSGCSARVYHDQTDTNK